MLFLVASTGWPETQNINVPWETWLIVQSGSDVQCNHKLAFYHWTEGNKLQIICHFGHKMHRELGDKYQSLLPHKRIFVDKMEFYIWNMHSNTMTNIKCIEINAMIKETILLIDFTTVFGFYYCTILWKHSKQQHK